jgi:hypothetical protein
MSILKFSVVLIAVLCVHTSGGRVVVVGRVVLCVHTRGYPLPSAGRYSLSSTSLVFHRKPLSSGHARLSHVTIMLPLSNLVSMVLHAMGPLHDHPEFISRLLTLVVSSMKTRKRLFRLSMSNRTRPLSCTRLHGSHPKVSIF